MSSRRAAGFRIGDRVRADHPRGSPWGSWSRYHGREGEVQVPLNYGEVGVRLDGALHTLVWFRPAELVALRTAPDRTHGPLRGDDVPLGLRLASVADVATGGRL